MADIFDTLDAPNTSAPAQQGGDIFDQIAPQPQAFLPNQIKVANATAQRPDSIQTLQKEINTKWDPNQHPVKSALQGPTTLMKMAAIPFQRAEAAVANPALAVQAGNFNPMNLADLAWKGASGQQQGQLGDLVRTTGFGEKVPMVGFGNVNEGLAATTGAVGAGALGNGMVESAPTLAKLASQGIGKAGNVVNKAINPPASTLIDKAQKITTEILQPSKTELASSINKGKQLPAVEEAAKIITKSKNYSELNNNIDSVIKDSFQKRNAILSGNNFKVDSGYLQEVNDLIKNLKSTGQSTPEEIKAMEDVLNRENDFINKNPQFNRLDAQSRKEKLQDMTHKLLERKENGEIIDRDPARNLALDAIRQGLRRVVNAGDPVIEKINDAYGGLKDAKWLVSGQDALARKAVPTNILQKAVSFITNPKSIPEAVANAALDRQGSLINKTKKIDKLMQRAGAKP